MAEVKSSNMAFETIGRTLVVVHNKDYPTDAEWDAYLHVLQTHLATWKDRRSLVLTDGGAPSSKQRMRMSELVAEGGAPTAVLTSAAPVLATVGALNLRNSAIRAFSPDDLQGALRHLGLSDGERRDITQLLPSLQQRVAATPASPGNAQGA